MKNPVKIVWRDPVSWTGWVHKDRIRDWAQDEEDGGLNESVGWIVETTKDNVIFAPSRQLHGGNLGDSHKLPRSIIIEVRDIRTNKKVKV